METKPTMSAAKAFWFCAGPLGDGGGGGGGGVPPAPGGGTDP